MRPEAGKHLHDIQHAAERTPAAWSQQIVDALADFHVVSELAGNPVTFGTDNVEFCPAPHRPPSSLPKGMMAVYGFWWNDEWLKIGRAGPKSAGRYTYQHYNPHSTGEQLGSFSGQRWENDRGSWS